MSLPIFRFVCSHCDQHDPVSEATFRGFVDPDLMKIVDPQIAEQTVAEVVADFDGGCPHCMPGVKHHMKVNVGKPIPHPYL